MTWWWFLAVLAAVPQGWRYDGGGAWPVDRAPVTWSASAGIAWTTPLPSWSNASPIIADDLVCVPVEPVTLTCLDRATGAVRWTADHPIVEATAPAQRAEVQAAIARRTTLETQLAEARTAYGAALRDARRGVTTAAATAEQLTAQLDRLKAELATVPEYRTPANQGMVGWSASTPVTDGRAIYALFANGVVAAHEHDGTLRWARWLGPMPDRMMGWDEGHAASPTFVDGTLIVPFRELRGLDPATGADRWVGEPWPHYGAPTATTLDGVGVVLTPSGRAYRARDGKLLREGMADMWFVGPVVTGRDAYFLEARSDGIMREQGGLDLIAWSLDGIAGDTLKATKRWTTKIPDTDTFYAAPVRVGDLLFAVTHAGTLWTIEAATGAIVGSTALKAVQPTVIWSSPTAAAGHLYIASERGQTVVLTATRTPEVVAVNPLGNTRSSPAFAGGRMFQRTEGYVIAVE